MAKGKKTDRPEDVTDDGEDRDGVVDDGGKTDSGQGKDGNKKEAELGLNLSEKPEEDPSDRDAAARVDNDASKTRVEAAAATVLTKDELRERVRTGATKEDLMVCFCAYLRMWAGTPVVKDFCRVVHVDSSAFAVKVFADFWTVIDEDGDCDDPIKIKEFFGEAEKTFFGESSVFDLEFPIVVTDENLPRLRHIAQVSGIGLSDLDISGKVLKGTVAIIGRLYEEEEGGEDIDKFVGGISSGFFDRTFGVGKWSKKMAVEFYLELTERGRVNLKILHQLEAIELNPASINAINTNFLKMFLALKKAKIGISNFGAGDFIEAEGKVSKGNIDLFCKIYGDTGYEIYSLKQISDLKNVKMTANGIRALRIFNGRSGLSGWQNCVEDLNALTDVGVEALEAFVGGFLEVTGSITARFKALNKISREQLEFFKSLKKVGLPEDVLFTLVVLPEAVTPTLAPLSEEEIGIVSFVLMEFTEVRNIGATEVVPLIRRIRNSGITLAELRAEIGKIDTSELRGALGKRDGGLKMVDMILFAYGGRESVRKLHGMESLLRGAGNVERIAEALRSRDETLGALVRDVGQPKHVGDFDLNNIVEVGEMNCERCLKLGKLFPVCAFRNKIPEFAYSITDEEWLVLAERAEKLGGLSDINAVAEVEKMIAEILKIEEEVFAEVPFFFRKIGSRSAEGLSRAVALAAEYGSKTHDKEVQESLMTVFGRRDLAERDGLTDLDILHELDKHFPKYKITSKIPGVGHIKRSQLDKIKGRLAAAPELDGLDSLEAIKILMAMSDNEFAAASFFMTRIKDPDVGRRFSKAATMVDHVGSGNKVSQLGTFQRLVEYFSDYEIPMDFLKVPDLPLVGAVKWEVVKERLAKVPELAKMKDLGNIREFLTMKDEVFNEFPFFFGKVSVAKGRFKGTCDLINHFASEGSDPAELAFLKKLADYFPNYKIDDFSGAFGQIPEARWERLKKRIDRVPDLVSMRGLEGAKAVLEMKNDEFDNLAYFLGKKWLFGNVDARQKLIGELGFLRKAGNVLDPADVGEIIEKSSTDQDLRLRVRAASLYDKNPERMVAFEKVLGLRPANADALLKGWEVYKDNDELFEMAAFLTGPAFAPEGFSVSMGSNLKDYIEHKKSLQPGDDEVKFFRKFAKERFVMGTNDFTQGKRLEEFRESFPEYDFLKEVNERNVLFLVLVYARIEDEDYHGEDSKELREHVKKLLDDNKGLALSVLNGIRDKVLVGDVEGMDDEEIMVRAMAGQPVEQYKILERTIQYINMILNLPGDGFLHGPEIEVVGKRSASLLGKFATKERGSRKINYSNDDYAGFYEKSMTVDRLDLPELLEAFDALQIDKENFDLMQQEIMGGAAVVKLLTGRYGIEGGKVRGLVVADGLVEFAKSLAPLRDELGAETDPVAQRRILHKFHEKLRKFIKEIFAETLGLQNLPELKPEALERIRPYLTYLSNIQNSDDKKKGIVGFFILLKLLDKWEEFKRGEDVEVDLYLTDGLKREVRPYLKGRKVLDIFEGEAEGEDGSGGRGKKDESLLIDPENRADWFKALAGKSEAILVGESGGVLDAMRQVEKRYKDLEDPDNFQGPEPALFGVVKKLGYREVFGSLTKRFKDDEFTDEITESLSAAGVSLEKKFIPMMQKLVMIFGNLIVFVAAVEDAKLGEKIESLEKAIKPDESVVAVFRKIGEEMTTTSGAKPVSEDIEHLESILHKKREELTEAEFAEAQAYIDGVKLEVLSLNNLKHELGSKFKSLSEAGRKTEISAIFQSRLDEFRKVFLVDDSQAKVTLKSTMTGDLGDVIPHLRQCLGCMAQECNNDTNLTFGDRNRFSVVAREFGAPDGKSIADELVTVQVTVEGGKKGYSFVMDNVYGQRSRDVLVCNVLAVLKKMKELCKLSPNTAMDIFVTDSALMSCGVGIDYLRDKLTAEVGGVDLGRVVKEVHIAQSASGDGHYEIGEGFDGRVGSKKGEVEGVKVWIK